MPSSNFNPSANSWGLTARIPNPRESWSTIQGGVGTYFTVGSVDVVLSAWTTANQWYELDRGIVNFDTSSIGAGKVVTAASLTVKGASKSLSGSISSPALNVFGVACTDPTQIRASDFNKGGTTAFSADISYASFNASGNNVFNFNSAGLSAINLTGYSQFMLRESTYDAPNVSPTWANNDFLIMQTTSVRTDYVLSVTYATSLPSSALFMLT